eukprot:1515378-Rhodomonas_salina.1
MSGTEILSSIRCPVLTEALQCTMSGTVRYMESGTDVGSSGTDVGSAGTDEGSAGTDVGSAGTDEGSAGTRRECECDLAGGARCYARRCYPPTG